MGNINKHTLTNTFHVNPPIATTGLADEMGVSFPHTDTTGIETPDKFVTVNAATNYKILDAVNLDWNEAKIPWAKEITVWGGVGRTINSTEGYTNDTDAYAVDYKYNKPEEGGWTEGVIRETEDVVDILNYLIYRTIAFDHFMEHWNDDNLQDPALRLVNHRTDWYGDTNPDNRDNDTRSGGEEHVADRRYTVKNRIKVYLYPYLLSKFWEQPNDTENELNTSWRTKLLDSNQANRPGVVVSDTGDTLQREKMFLGNNFTKINPDGENFDIYEVETASDMTDIRFISSNKRMLDGYVQNYIQMTEPDTDGAQFGGLTTISTQLTPNVPTGEEPVDVCRYLYKLPIVAYKCIGTEEYPYTPIDLLKRLTKINWVGLPDGKVNTTCDNCGSVTNNERYKQMVNSATTPEVDKTRADVSFTISIPKSPAVSEGEEGYKSATKLYTVTIYKGDNTIKDFKLLGKSVQKEDIHFNPVSITERDSHNNPVEVKVYKTDIDILNRAEDYNNPDLAAANRYKIIFEAEFDRNYDKSHFGSDEEVLKKSYMYPYFVSKPYNASSKDFRAAEMQTILDAINGDAYDTIYKDTFDPETIQRYVLFDHERYGKIYYEKIDNEWGYWYYPPTKDKLVAAGLIDEENLTYKVKLFGLMYYPPYDKTTNRLLNPLWVETTITLHAKPKN